MSETVATKAAAEACETTPRTLRVFLRAGKDYEAVGSGGRYAFTEDDLPELKTRFNAWVAERDAAQAAREKAAQDAKAKEKATKSDDDVEAEADDEDSENDDTEEDNEPEEKPAARRSRARKPKTETAAA